jgi:hypothetical protein
MGHKIARLLLAAAIMSASVAASAEVRITEFMYKGADDGNREFFELTNLGASAVNISSWSYNDNNSNDPLNFGASFGLLAAHESIILTEMSASAFRTYWSLPNSVRIFSIGGSSNMGSSDTLNIYTSSAQNAGTLIESVSYSGTTAGVSRNRPLAAIGAVANAQFVNSSVGDVFGSHLAAGQSSQDLANPGSFLPPIPEPKTWALMIAGFGLVGASLRRRALVRFA